MLQNLESLIVLGLAVLFGLAFGALMVAIVLSAYFERLPIHGYEEVDLSSGDLRTHARMLSRYVKHMSDGAMKKGFKFGSMFIATNYAVSGTVWMSTDRKTMMITGSGKIVGMSSRKTLLITPLDDGTWIVTTDLSGATYDPDFERLTRAINATFSELYECMIQIADEPVTEFPDGRPLELANLREQVMTEFKIESGKARYRDPEQKTSSYTFSAALGKLTHFSSGMSDAQKQEQKMKQGPVASPELDLPAGPLIQQWSRPQR